MSTISSSASATALAMAPDAVDAAIGVEPLGPARGLGRLAPEGFRRLWRYSRAYRRNYTIGVLVIFMIDVLDVTWPILLALGVDSIQAAGYLGHGLGTVFMFAGLLILTVIFQGYFRFWMRMLFIATGFRVIRRLRQRFFAHLTTLPPSYFHTIKTGELMSRATNDLQAIRMFMGLGILLLADFGFYLLLVPIPMIWFSAKLTLLCALPLPLIPFFVRRLSHEVHQRFEVVQDKFGDIADRVHESFSGVKVVKSFVREDHETERFQQVCADYRTSYKRMAKLDALFNPTFVAIAGIQYVLILGIGGQEVVNGSMTLGAFLAFFTYVIKLTDPLIEIGWLISLYQRSTASLKRVEAVLETEPLIQNAETTITPVSCAGRLEFRALTFTYPGSEHPALREIELVVPAGGTLAIMGAVGAGKSTLVSLVPRLVDSPPGAVRLDGHDIRTLDLAWLRRQIGMVPQETFLFSESVADNIALGVPGAPREAIERAARISRLDHDLAEFPNGYDTLLGERGVNLSGGQKQRLALARAILREPPVLILDDALSAVDTDTEQAILAGLRQVMRERTTLLVTHRASAAMTADTIVLLDAGRIVEHGSHAELVAANGEYAGLFRAQHEFS